MIGLTKITQYRNHYKPVDHDIFIQTHAFTHTSKPCLRSLPITTTHILIGHLVNSSPFLPKNVGVTNHVNFKNDHIMSSLQKLIIFSTIFIESFVASSDYSFIDLPENHLPYYFNTFPQIATQCLNDYKCEYRDFLMNDDKTRSCWGYESDCKRENAYYTLKCPGNFLLQFICN